MNKTKVCVYSYRDFDEKMIFDEYIENDQLELLIHAEPPTKENYRLAQGCESISVLTIPIDAELVELFASIGVRHISTRSIGFDHIDLEAAKQFNIQVSNANYPPESVANYTIMMMLMATRNMKRIMGRGDLQDFTLKGLMGKDFGECTIGIVGTGRIGATVIRHLQGFNNKILAYSLFEDESLKDLVTYVDYETLIREADIISFHIPMDASNYHMVNKDTLAMMKEGVILVNTARGGLIDHEALIAAIESGKIGAVALDVIEHEEGYYYNDFKSEIINNRTLMTLKGYPNVTITPHMAFYTKNAVRGMVESSMKSCLCVAAGTANPWKVN